MKAYTYIHTSYKGLLGVLLASLLLWGSTACTNLEEELFSEIPSSLYPENDIQASLITLPMYDPLNGWVDWAGWWFCNEISGDAIVVPTRHSDWDDGGKWRELHQHNWTNKTEALAQMWPNFYNGITACNKIIDMLGENSENPTTQATLAKVKVMRSYYYYCLIDNFGDVPYLTSFANAPEKPYKLKRAKVWEKVVADVENVLPLISNGKGSRNSVNKGMAFALLAKLYINAEVYTGTAQWSKAEAYCDSVIAMGYTLESDFMAPFVTKNENSDENIFAIAFDKNLKKNNCLHMRTLHYNHDKKFNMIASPWNGIAVVEAFFDTYDDADLRKSKYFLHGPQVDASGAPLQDVELGILLNLTKNIPALIMDSKFSKAEMRCSGVRLNKFEVENGAGQDLSNDFPIFRYADILMMKAECMIRTGRNGDEYLRDIRQRVGLQPFSGCTLDDLLAERGRELIWEGHRRQDLIRFGKFGGAWWEKSPSTKDREVFMIPQEQTDKNSNLLAPAKDDQ